MPQTVQQPEIATPAGLPVTDLRIALYRTMCLTRRFEETAYELALAREVLGTRFYIGQEAVAVGIKPRGRLLDGRSEGCGAWGVEALCAGSYGRVAQDFLGSLLFGGRLLHLDL